MSSPAATCTALPDGRWHFQHGPIDIVAGADGDVAAVAQAHRAAGARFASILAELVAELPLLRTAVQPAAPCPLQGVVARRMWAACAPHAAGFITPMAAVAGAVAEELIACYAQPGIHRAWVNNGGDIALHLLPGQAVRVGLFADLARLDGQQLLNGHNGLDLDGRFTVQADQPVRGIATSGWRGRSFSLGIADAVTVLAATAAQADAAATVVANAVNAVHPAVQRQPASSLRDDSDLGDRLATVQVPALPPDVVRDALARGHAVAAALQASGLLAGALLVCQGQMRALEPMPVSMLMATSDRPPPPAVATLAGGTLPPPEAPAQWS